MNCHGPGPASAWPRVPCSCLSLPVLPSLVPEQILSPAHHKCLRRGASILHNHDAVITPKSIYSSLISNIQLNLEFFQGHQVLLAWHIYSVFSCAYVLLLSYLKISSRHHDTSFVNTVVLVLLRVKIFST